MVSLENKKVTFIQGKEYFANTYKLALKSGFPITDLEIKRFGNQFFIARCGHDDFENLCYYALEASFKESNVALHDFSLFFIYNSMIPSEEVLIKMDDKIKSSINDIDRKKALYYRIIHKCINSELKEIEKRKKYQKIK